MRAVGVPVAAAIEPVSNHLSRGGFYGRDSAEAGEGGLALQALCGLSLRPRSAALPHGVRTDTRKGTQLRGRLCHQPIQLLLI